MNDELRTPLKSIENLWVQFAPMASSVPILDSEKLDKQIQDMKTVAHWMEANLTLLQNSIRVLEMQKMTFNAVKENSLAMDFFESFAKMGQSNNMFKENTKMSVSVGNNLPHFSGQMTSDKIFNLSQISQTHTNLVLYFYPRDNTPGCTDETKDFSSLYADFQRNQCEVIGISRDSLKSHEKFKLKLDIPFELISDADEKICRLFDVLKEKNMYGKKVIGIERSTFLIRQDGLLLHEWRKVKVPGHAQEVLETVKSRS